MSIKKTDVECQRTRDGLTFVFSSRLRVVSNENIVKQKKIAVHELEEATDIMFENLRMSIIAYIYGDLIEPINAIAKIAIKRSIPGTGDFNIVMSERKKIQDILFGLEPEETDETKKKGIIKLLS